MRYLIFVSFLCAAGPVFGQTCTTMPPRDTERAGLLSALAGSPNELAGQTAANKLWEFWMKAPDSKAQVLLEDGMARRNQSNFAAAKVVLDELVAYCPSYAEGWNQRAFVRYLQADFEGSLEDIEKTLELEPDHFGALSGKALALMGLGRPGLAKLAMVRATQVHPWLQERGILGEGEDI